MKICSSGVHSDVSTPAVGVRKPVMPPAERRLRRLAGVGELGRGEVLHHGPHLGGVAERRGGVAAGQRRAALVGREVERRSPGPRPSPYSVPSGKKAAKKLAWRCIMQSPSTSGVPLLRKSVLTMSPPSAYTMPSVFHRSITCLHRRDDLGRVERHLVGDPLVVEVDALLAQDELLGPVGERPARGVLGPDADAQRGVAVGDHRLGEGDELVPRRRDLVALLGERRRQVPHDRLEVGLERQGVQGIVESRTSPARTRGCSRWRWPRRRRAGAGRRRWPRTRRCGRAAGSWRCRAGCRPRPSCRARPRSRGCPSR